MGPLRLLAKLVTVAALFSALGPVVAAAGPSRPVVFVPGILGSRLCDSSGKVLWGRSDSLSNLSDLALRPQPKPGVTSCGIVTEIQILGPLWSIHQYDSLLETFQRLGYREGENLFVFDYDWRQSNFNTAKRLAEFIHTKVRPGVSFDIVAHSMGGLVTRIYLHDLPDEDAKRIRTAFYMGTPFSGSANTFGLISHGWGAIENRIAGGKERIRETVLSLPSFIELLPRYDKCCYVREADGAQTFLPIFALSTWVQMGWLPKGAVDFAGDLEFLNSLKRAASLDEYTKGPANRGIREVMVAGDRHSTRLYLGMPRANTRPDGWIFTMAGGDGTVPKWSAANAVLGQENVLSDSIAGSLTSFTEHATIFDDKWVQEQLARELLAAAPPTELAIAGAGAPSIRVRRGGQEMVWQIESISLIPRDATVVKGTQVKALLTIEFEKDVPIARSSLVPTIVVRSKHRTQRLVVSEETTPDDLLRHRLRFSASGYAAEAAGLVDIEANLGPIAGHAYVAVIE